MATQQETLLRRATTVRRVDALFRAMSTDFLLREQFITNPTQVLCEYVHGERLPPDRAEICNQLLYAIVSDRKLLVWFHEYAYERRGKVPTGEEFVQAFSQAVVDRSSKNVVQALLKCAGQDKELYGFDEDLLHFLMDVGAIRAGLTRDIGTDVAAAEAVAADDAVAAGTLTAVTWSTFVGTGTSTSPSTGTDPFTRSPFTRPTTAVVLMNDEFGPDYVMVTLDALADYAFRLKETGALGPT